MTDLTQAAQKFLASQNLANARTEFLAGDFSARRYYRVFAPAGSKVLMCAPADAAMHNFIKISTLLRSLAARVPEIYASDLEHGFLLLEDFGDEVMGALLGEGSAAITLYAKAADTVLALQKRFDSVAAAALALPVFDEALFLEQVMVFADLYAPAALGRQLTATERTDFAAAWQAVLPLGLQVPNSILLRDFQADNVMVLKDGTFGLLDFQDAGVGPVTYDLISISERVRRDVHEGVDALLIEKCMAAYPTLSKTEIENSFIVLSAQRHCRILSMITRAALNLGKADKLAYIPRVWAHFNALLKQPVLAPVANWMDKTVPQHVRENAA